jgi:iron complex outermembrane receptor protein
VLSRVRPINFSSLKTSGVDLLVSYGIDMGGAGRLGFDLQYSKVLDYKTQDIIGGPMVNQTGRYGVPAWRANTDISWNMGRWTVALHSFYIPSYAETTNLNPDFSQDASTWFLVPEGKLDNYMHHNLLVAYETPWNARIAVGVNNVTDEDPVLDSALAYDSSLNPLVSRAYVASYTQRF